MSFFDCSFTPFIQLIKAGLWEKDVCLSSFGDIDYDGMYRIAEEQSVLGLVAAGLEKVVDVKVPQDVALTFAGTALQIEQQNVAMNTFIAKLIEKMRKAGIYTLLLKGQGVAQCYERPLWRSVGDIDFFLSDSNYKEAEMFFSSITDLKEDEKPYYKHIAYTIDTWVVELHGTLRGGLWRGVDKGIEDVQQAVFYEGKVRSWVNGNTQIFLPHADEDVVYIFSHILQHFFKEGIGLRQICDWCRILWKFRDVINKNLLESRINRMGVMSEWKTFAYLIVNSLGMPVEAMPFYSSDKKWKRKADRVLRFILNSGNFGHNRDYSYYTKYPFLVYKTISAWKHIKDAFEYFLIFPLDTIKVTERRMRVGMKIALKGGKHE